MAEPTNRLVDAYYEHWGRGDFDALGRILTGDFVFRGPLDAADGPAALIEVIRRNAPMFGSVQFEDLRRDLSSGLARSLAADSLSEVGNANSDLGRLRQSPPPAAISRTLLRLA